MQCRRQLPREAAAGSIHAPPRPALEPPFLSRTTMRLRSLGVVLLLLAGCARPIRIESPTPAAATVDWSAALAPGASASGIGGAVSVQSGAGRTTAVVSITGVQAGSRLAWQIRRGPCGEGGAMVGEASDYLPLVVGSAGRAAAQVILSAALEPDAAYAVEVHASADPASAVIACGQLQRGAGEGM